MTEKKLWSRSETLQLIEKFEENQGLWDPTLGRNSGYLKKIKKHTLQKLAAEFNTSDIEVGRKLHNLKTQFSQELKKEQQHTSSGEVYKTKWQYFEMMKFLQPTVNQNSSVSTDDSLNSSTNRIEAIEEELAINTPSVKRNKKCAPQKKFNGDHDHPRPSKVSNKEDEYKIFGDYVANEIKNMHFMKYKGLLKRKIQRLIIEFTEIDDNEYWKLEEDVTAHENGACETVYQSKPGPSQVKDENEITESMYLVINGIKHFLDNSPQRQDDPLGKV